MLDQTRQILAKARRDLFHNQRKGVAFLERNHKAILAHGMGSGKSLTAIDAADRLDLRNNLIVCPAIGRTSWKIQFETHAPGDAYAFVHKAADLDSDARWKIVSYDGATKLAAEIAKRSFDLLILDEAQACKNPLAKRTIAIYGRRCDGKAPAIISCARKIWLLTGSLCPNAHHEAWPHIYALRPDLLPRVATGQPIGLAHFISQFCLVKKIQIASGRTVETVVGSKNAEDFDAMIRPFCQRIPSDELAKSLPELAVRETPVELKRAERAAVEAIEIEIETLAREMGVSAAEALASQNVESAGIRRRLGLLKVRGAIDHVENIIESSEPDEKVVCFFHHRAVGDMMSSGLAKHGVVLVDGSTTQARRDDAVDRFQNDPSVRVAILQIQAASTSITMTAGRFAVIVEASFTPETNRQAIGRLHRAGQKRPVVAEFLVVPDSYDERVMAIVADKARGMSRQ